MDRITEIERSIIKDFRKEIWCQFTKAVNDYSLICDGDHIAVCISGGKDSMLMAKCIQERQKHGKIKFRATYIVMDPGYNSENRILIEQNLALLQIPAQFFSTGIFDIVDDIAADAPCYLCARMRRGKLYAKATALGCNKIALGHHFDDVIETILLSMLYSGEVKTMLPKLRSSDLREMELIRPMYLVKEEDVLAWKDFNQLTFINCACRFTEKKRNDDGNGHKRNEMKELIRHFRKINSNIDINIFRSVENVNLDAIVAYRTKGQKHHYLDTYEDL